MSTKREPVGVRCTPIKQGNGTYYVHMRRSSGSRPHSNGEYFSNGRFTVQSRPDGDIVRAVIVEDDEIVAASSPLLAHALLHLNYTNTLTLAGASSTTKGNIAPWMVNAGWDLPSEGSMWFHIGAEEPVNPSGDPRNESVVTFDKFWLQVFSSVPGNTLTNHCGLAPLLTMPGVYRVTSEVYQLDWDIAGNYTGETQLPSVSWTITVPPSAENPAAEAGFSVYYVQTSEPLLIDTYGTLVPADTWTAYWEVDVGLNYYRREYQLRNLTINL